MDKDGEHVVKEMRHSKLKKEGVAMSMMFRDHNDPLYYDPKSNDKIFVPIKDTVSTTRSTLTNLFQSTMTEAQKRIVASFPQADRGEWDDNEETKAIVEEDFEVAAHKKYLAKQMLMKEKKRIRDTGRIELSDSNSDMENADILDSEEEEF